MAGNRRKKSVGKASSPPQNKTIDSASWKLWLVFSWGLLAHGLFLWRSSLRATPVNLFYFGDSLEYLSQARHLAEGLVYNFGLPFRPPLTSWLLAPLWKLANDPATVSLAAKVLMATLAATSYSLLYRLLRQRFPWAFAACLLMPLSFGEVVLTSSVNNELLYRVLLLLIVLVGFRWPLVAGGLQGLAALTRAEHLIFGLFVAVGIVVLAPNKRRFVAWAFVGAMALVVPYSVWTSSALTTYNQANAGRLPEPLPKVVPVSFYGPLNFLLAQREDDIHFSRKTLPPAPGGATALDPSFPPHNEAILHGYRLGLGEIAADPGRFVHRAIQKATHSLNALAFGWTWRDVPKLSQWSRQPVDVAYSSSSLYLLFSLGLGVLGAWSCREDRPFLAIGFGLLAYRLAINVLFFPYLRSVLIVGPFWIAVSCAGVYALSRRWGTRPLLVLVAMLGMLHALPGYDSSAFEREGERAMNGVILDDRPMIIRRR